MKAEIDSRIDSILKSKGSAISMDPDTAKALRRIKRLVKELDV